MANVGVFDRINAALTGKPPPPAGGVGKGPGYNPAPVPVPPSVAAARQKMLDMQGAMGAHADKVHPVKP